MNPLWHEQEEVVGALADMHLVKVEEIPVVGQCPAALELPDDAESLMEEVWTQAGYFDIAE